MENLRAMEDIAGNPDGVYGFSPKPESERVGSYAVFAEPTRCSWK